MHLLTDCCSYKESGKRSNKADHSSCGRSVPSGGTTSRIHRVSSSWWTATIAIVSAKPGTSCTGCSMRCALTPSHERHLLANVPQMAKHSTTARAHIGAVRCQACALLYVHAQQCPHAGRSISSGLFCWRSASCTSSKNHNCSTCRPKMLLLLLSPSSAAGRAQTSSSRPAVLCG